MIAIYYANNNNDRIIKTPCIEQLSNKTARYHNIYFKHFIFIPKQNGVINIWLCMTCSVVIRKLLVPHIQRFIENRFRFV